MDQLRIRGGRRDFSASDQCAGGDAGQVKPAPWVFSDDVPLDIASLRALSRRVDPTTVRAFAYAHSGPQKADLGKLGLVE